MTICAAHLASFPGCVGPGNEAGDISVKVWTVSQKIGPHRIWFERKKISYRVWSSDHIRISGVPMHKVVPPGTALASVEICC